MMARVRPHRCIMCGTPKNVRLWTIDNLSTVTVTYLCRNHAAPLAAIVEAAGNLPPDQQVPMPDRGTEPVGNLDVHKRGRKQPVMVPLNWTPPAPRPEPVLTVEEKLVKQALKDGKTWPEISETLGTPILDTVEKYSHLWEVG